MKKKLTRAFALIGAIVVPTLFYDKAVEKLHEKAEDFEQGVSRVAGQFHEVSQFIKLSYEFKTQEVEEAVEKFTPEQLEELKAIMAAEVYLRDYDGMVCTYQIKSGDTLFKISQKFKVPLETIRAPNPEIHNADLIHTDNMLVIPVPHDFVHPDLKVMTSFERAKPLLDFIGKLESGGRYNRVFGHKDIDFSRKPVAQVLAWQDQYVRNGSAS